MMGSPGVPGALLSGWDLLVFPRVRATGGWLDGREDSGTPSSQVFGLTELSVAQRAVPTADSVLVQLPTSQPRWLIYAGAAQIH